MIEQPICAHGFNSTICVAPAGHAGAHVTSNERFPHGLAIIQTLELRGPALPAPEPPDPELIAALALIADYGWVYDGRTTLTINCATPAEAKRLGAALEAAWRARTAGAVSPGKRARLEAAGWKLGDAAEFLALPAEHAPPDTPSPEAIDAALADEASRAQKFHYNEQDKTLWRRCLQKWEIAEMLKAAYAVDFGGSRPALTGSPDAFLPYLKHKLTCAIGKMEFAPPKRWPDPSTLESCNLPCDCGLAELLAGVRGARGAAPEEK